MRQSDYDNFVDLWLTAHEISVSNKQPSNNAVDAIFETLIDYELIHIKKSLLQHRKMSKFAPTPADIIDLLESSHQHLSADEAWALCPASELETVVWTNEIAQAWAVCSNLFYEGDKIGARMAFKSAYERITNISQMQGIRPRWSVCLGDDKSGIEPVVTKAVSMGRISQQQANKALPPSQESGLIGKMLTGKVVDINSKNKEKIKVIKKSMAEAEERRAKAEQEELKRRANERDAFEQRRKEAVDYCESKSIKKPVINGKST